MPNALDDAMMKVMEWNEGMDKLLKKIRETFSPAEIEEGIEYMLWRREDKEKELKMLKPNKEDPITLYDFNEAKKIGQLIASAATNLRYAVERGAFERADYWKQKLNLLLEKRKVGDIP